MADELFGLATRLPRYATRLPRYATRLSHYATRLPGYAAGAGLQLTLRGLEFADSLVSQWRGGPRQVHLAAPPVTQAEEALHPVVEPERSRLATGPAPARPRPAPPASPAAPQTSPETSPVPEPAAVPPAAQEIAIPDIDHLTVPSVRSRLRRLDREQLAALRSYEETHGHRAAVLTAIDNRLAKLDAAPPAGG